MEFKNIHIGTFIKQAVTEAGIDIYRICSFLKYSEDEIEKMYKSKSLDTEILLRWSKLLKYDFFRFYTQHLILYAPQVSKENHSKNEKSGLPQFRKNIYTKEIIEFILELIETKMKSRKQIIEEYKIPKTTLYKWISKYGKNEI